MDHFGNGFNRPGVSRAWVKKEILGIVRWQDAAHLDAGSAQPPTEAEQQKDNSLHGVPLVDLENPSLVN